jgi:hypothetical protein
MVSMLVLNADRLRLGLWCLTPLSAMFQLAVKIPISPSVNWSGLNALATLKNSTRNDPIGIPITTDL